MKLHLLPTDGETAILQEMPKGKPSVVETATSNTPLFSGVTPSTTAARDRS